MIAEYQLQGVIARRQRDGGFRLAFAEMDMIFVSGKAEIEFFGAIFTLTQRRAVNQQMVMACVLFFDAGGRNAHAGKPEANRYGRPDGGAVFKPDEINCRALG